jgi:hypothetical protein
MSVEAAPGKVPPEGDDVQFDEVLQLPLALPFHVYVVAVALTFLAVRSESINAKQNNNCVFNGLSLNIHKTCSHKIIPHWFYFANK